jgi:hypothetical protein
VHMYRLLTHQSATRLYQLLIVPLQLLLLLTQKSLLPVHHLPFLTSHSPVVCSACVSLPFVCSCCCPPLLSPNRSWRQSQSLRWCAWPSQGRPCCPSPFLPYCLPSPLSCFLFTPLLNPSVSLPFACCCCYCCHCCCRCCCCPPPSQILEAVTKFAVVRLAITGEALLPCCRSTADLLARNLLDSVGVWWFPGMVLQVTALLAAGLWGAAVAGGSYLYWGRSQVGERLRTFASLQSQAFDNRRAGGTHAGCVGAWVAGGGQSGWAVRL